MISGNSMVHAFADCLRKATIAPRLSTESGTTATRSCSKRGCYAELNACNFGAGDFLTRQARGYLDCVSEMPRSPFVESSSSLHDASEMVERVVDKSNALIAAIPGPERAPRKNIWSTSACSLSVEARIFAAIACSQSLGRSSTAMCACHNARMFDCWFSQSFPIEILQSCAALRVAHNPGLLTARLLRPFPCSFKH